MEFPGRKPEWLTFDCYGTLIQWDEGLLKAIQAILATREAGTVDPATVIAVYDKHEHALETRKPHLSFRSVAGEGLRMAMQELGLANAPADVEILTSGISRMPPFPEVVDALAALKALGFRLCIISNTDDDIIAGNVAQMGGHIDRVITAQQVGWYKPSRQIFDHAHRELGVKAEDVIHICASPHLDLAAARDIGFRSIWIDRGTGRKPLPNFTPNQTFSTLDQVPAFFRTAVWA